jgi:hypothetical protein
MKAKAHSNHWKYTIPGVFAAVAASVSLFMGSENKAKAGEQDVTQRVETLGRDLEGLDKRMDYLMAKFCSMPGEVGEEIRKDKSLCPEKQTQDDAVISSHDL